MIVTRHSGRVFIGYGPLKHCAYCKKNAFSQIWEWYNENRACGIPGTMGGKTTLMWTATCEGCDRIIATFSRPTLFNSQYDSMERLNSLLIDGMPSTKSYFERLAAREKRKFLRELKRSGLMGPWQMLQT